MLGFKRPVERVAEKRDQAQHIKAGGRKGNVIEIMLLREEGRDDIVINKSCGSRVNKGCKFA